MSCLNSTSVSFDLFEEHPLQKKSFQQKTRPTTKAVGRELQHRRSVPTALRTINEAIGTPGSFSLAQLCLEM